MEGCPGSHVGGYRGALTCSWGEAGALGGTVGWWGCSSSWIVAAEERAARGFSLSSGRALQWGGLRRACASAQPSSSRKPWEAEEVQLLPGALSWLWEQGQPEARLLLSHAGQPHRGQPQLQRDHADSGFFHSRLLPHNSPGSGGRGMGLLLLLLEGECPAFHPEHWF